MAIALSAAAMVPTVGEIGAAGAAFGPVGLAVAAVAIVGYIAYEAGFFDWLGDVLADGWNWLKNGFGKVVQKAKSVVQDDIIPEIKNLINWISKETSLEGKGDKEVEEAEEARRKGEPRKKHKTNKGRTNPIKGEPNSSEDLLNPDGSVKQRRYYGPDKRAQEDIDFNHTDDGTHTFPHRHIWDWNKNPPRQDSR